MSNDFLQSFSPFFKQSSLEGSPATRSKGYLFASDLCISPFNMSFLKSDQTPTNKSPHHSQRRTPLAAADVSKSPKKGLQKESEFQEPLAPRRFLDKESQLHSRKLINFSGGSEASPDEQCYLDGLERGGPLRLHLNKSSIKICEVIGEDKSKLSPISTQRSFHLFPQSEQKGEIIGLISPHIKQMGVSPCPLLKVPSKPGMDGSTASSQISETYSELDQGGLQLFGNFFLSPMKQVKKSVDPFEQSLEMAFQRNQSHDEFLLQQIATNNFSCISPCKHFQDASPPHKRADTFALNVDQCRQQKKPVQKKRVAKEQAKRQVTLLEKLCSGTVATSVASKYQTRQQPPTEEKTAKKCNCSQSKCLKLYCECFANGGVCGPDCGCKDCCNQEAFSSVIQEARDEILKRDPNAFSSKVTKLGGGKKMQHRKGCTCKKSGCLKGYCECFQLGVPCTEACKCSGCANCDPHKKAPTEHKVQEKEIKPLKPERKVALGVKRTRRPLRNVDSK